MILSSMEGAHSSDHPSGDYLLPRNSATLAGATSSGPTMTHSLDFRLIKGMSQHTAGTSAVRACLSLRFAGKTKSRLCLSFSLVLGCQLQIKPPFSMKNSH